MRQPSDKNDDLFPDEPQQPRKQAASVLREQLAAQDEQRREWVQAQLDKQQGKEHTTITPLVSDDARPTLQ